MITPGAVTLMHPIVLLSMTVPGVETVEAPVYGVSTVPAGTPVLVALGNGVGAAGGVAVGVEGGAAVDVAVGSDTVGTGSAGNGDPDTGTGDEEWGSVAGSSCEATAPPTA